ncbi:MAG: complex I NDUFA9 subunit family protein [Luteibacter sp.]|uniref:complex I NDUFA9 subunit family protein n=1 Tax=Luteibacter sp. TaxID=1886636 RepID=UPI002806DE65|nr:complex I NDUFA9 subunit family protein [Luteibacter sp.]MDQ7996616.1 complex I NDUFA9 subunit family protein [Luteibacter sp.]MDQ8048405.1 complex I NDUFA9 subunit family protein [Luteibacter sp.]
MNAQRIVILGGTGFVGGTLVPRLAADGHSLLLLSRNRENRRHSAVGRQVTTVSADVYDPAVLRRHIAGADAVINLVGILSESGRQTFQRAHVELTRLIIEACQATGVHRLHQMSSLKAGQGLSRYLRSRGEAEALVKASTLDWTIYQPSTIFGPGDGLVTRFDKLLRVAPVMPLPRPQAKMAPVYVGDVAEAIARSVANPAIGALRTFELYGPETLTLIDIVRAIRDARGRRRVVIPMPDSLGRLQAEFAQFVPGKPFTPDNFLSLRTDSVGKVDGLAQLGVAPQSFSAWLPRLLGQPVRQRRLDEARTKRRP